MFLYSKAKYTLECPIWNTGKVRLYVERWQSEHLWHIFQKLRTMHTIWPTSLFWRLPHTHWYRSQTDLQASIDISFDNPSLKSCDNICTQTDSVVQNPGLCASQSSCRSCSASLAAHVPSASHISRGGSAIANTDFIVIFKVNMSGGWSTDKWVFFIGRSHFTLLHWYLRSNYNLDFSVVNHFEWPFYFLR